MSQSLETVGAGKQHHSEKSATVLQRYVEGGYNLPIPPSILLRLMDLGKDVNATPDHYAEVISASNSLSARILSSVNSSWFGVRRPIRKVPQAVSMLGMVSVRILAITHCLASIHERVRLPDRILKQYWQASLVKGEAARYLADHKAEAVADEAFLVGLMQDMVVPLMHRLAPEPYDQMLDGRALALPERCALEQDLFGMDHARAGEILGRTLGLPPLLCDAVGRHHDRSALLEVCDEPVLADAVYFSGLFPHVCTDWATREAEAAAAVIEEGLTGTVSVTEALREISDRAHQLTKVLSPAGAEALDLPALLADATDEVAQTTTSMVGQINSMMSNTTQAASQLTAMNAEALRLQEQAQTDGLTGVLNRLGLEEVGAEMFERIRAERQSLMLIFADLDDFKAVNDCYGHDMGDRVLRVLAAALQDVYGPAATVGRYGGDEFAVLLGGVPDCERANALGRKVLDTVAGGVPGDASGPAPIGLSIGGIWCPVVPDTVDFPKILAVADKLMYSAKADEVDSVQIKTVVG